MRVLSRNILVCLLGGAALLCGAEPAFEAVAIHPIEMSYPWQMGPTTFRMQGTLRSLIAFAEQIEVDQVTGGPDWAASSSFDIQTRTTAPATVEQFRRLLAAMLVERFQLKRHREMRNVQVYELVVSGNTSRLKPSPEGTPRDGRGALAKDRTSLSGRGVSMELLASYFRTPLSRPVLNKTGLAGIYNFEIEGNDGDEFGGPEFILKSLGLAVKSAQGPVPYEVIESAIKPANN